MKHLTTTVEIPFTYGQSYMAPRHRNASHATLRSDVNVELRSVTSGDVVAMPCKALDDDEQIVQYADFLYRPMLSPNGSFVSVEDFRQLSGDLGTDFEHWRDFPTPSGKVSAKYIGAPEYGRQANQSTKTAAHFKLGYSSNPLENPVVLEADKVREMGQSNLPERFSAVLAKANAMLVVDGQIFVPAEPPVIIIHHVPPTYKEKQTQTYARIVSHEKRVAELKVNKAAKNHGSYYSETNSTRMDNELLVIPASAWGMAMAILDHAPLEIDSLEILAELEIFEKGQVEPAELQHFEKEAALEMDRFMRMHLSEFGSEDAIKQAATVYTAVAAAKSPGGRGDEALFYDACSAILSMGDFIKEAARFPLAAFPAARMYAQQVYSLNEKDDEALDIFAGMGL